MKKHLEELANALYDELKATEINDDGSIFTLDEVIEFQSVLENAFPNYIFKFDGVSKWMMVSEI